MTLKTIADKAHAQICETVSSPLSDDERLSILKIVEQSVREAAADTSQCCCDVVETHAAHHTDLASKLMEEIKQAETIQIANLMGMR